MAGAKTRVSDCSQVAARNDRTCLRGQKWICSRDAAEIPRNEFFHNDGAPVLKARFILDNQPFQRLRMGRRAPGQRQALTVQRPAQRQLELRVVQHFTYRLAA